MQALVVLAQADGAVVSRDKLIERCWGGRIVGDDAINNCIGKVRALASLTPLPTFEIETVSRVGYRLIPALSNDSRSPTAQSVAGEHPAASFLEAQQSDVPSFGPNGGFRRVFWSVAFAGAVLVAALALFVGKRLIESQPANQAPVSLSQTTVAILPFAPLYSDRTASVYADEISSDVADTLGQTDLNVISPALSFQFRGNGKGGAAGALHADILVDGDVRRKGENLDVAVRVEDVASSLVLLSTDIVAPAAEAADLPDRVATFIAGALGWDVSIRALNSGKRWDPRIRTGVLRAVFQCPHRQDPFCAYEIGRELASIAPDNAIAQTILAIETSNVLDRLPKREQQAAIDKAREAAWRAIYLDPHFAEPYIALSEFTSNAASKEFLSAARIGGGSGFLKRNRLFECTLIFKRPGERGTCRHPEGRNALQIRGLVVNEPGLAAASARANGRRCGSRQAGTTTVARHAIVRRDVIRRCCIWERPCRCRCHAERSHNGADPIFAGRAADASSHGAGSAHTRLRRHRSSGA